MLKYLAGSLWGMLLFSNALMAQNDSSAGPTQDKKSTAAEVEDILTREPQASDYGEDVRCVNVRRIRRTEILDERHIVLHMGREQFYLIQFRQRCPGLRPNQAVVYETTTNNRLCKLDGIRPIYDHGLSGRTPGMRCSVPNFQSVTKEQVLVLKDTLKVQARQAREARKASKAAEKEARRQEKLMEKKARQADRAAEGA